jgi:hypothetical protein
MSAFHMPPPGVFARKDDGLTAPVGVPTTVFPKGFSVTGPYVYPPMCFIQPLSMLYMHTFGFNASTSAEIAQNLEYRSHNQIFSTDGGISWKKYGNKIQGTVETSGWISIYFNSFYGHQKVVIGNNGYIYRNFQVVGKIRNFPPPKMYRKHIIPPSAYDQPQANSYLVYVSSVMVPFLNTIVMATEDARILRITGLSLEQESPIVPSDVSLYDMFYQTQELPNDSGDGAVAVTSIAVTKDYLNPRIAYTTKANDVFLLPSAFVNTPNTHINRAAVTKLTDGKGKYYFTPSISWDVDTPLAFTNTGTFTQVDQESLGDICDPLLVPRTTNVQRIDNSNTNKSWLNKVRRLLPNGTLETISYNDTDGTFTNLRIMYPTMYCNTTGIRSRYVSVATFNDSTLPAGETSRIGFVESYNGSVWTVIPHAPNLLRTSVLYEDGNRIGFDPTTNRVTVIFAADKNLDGLLTAPKSKAINFVLT